MKWLKRLAILLGAYLALVVAFEVFVGVVGKRQAAAGVQAGEIWLVLTTSDAEGSHDTVLAGVESAGQLYISANHWPRRWYDRAIENPDVEITRAGARKAYRAVPVTGEERERIARDYKLPFVIRILAGFPPRSYLRLDPR